ncbi:MAG: serine hydrolase [Chloroflexi bacterium]|nr:serine hydrolase [Chloroflexota bacterium]
MKKLTKLLNQKTNDEQFSGVVALWQDGQPFFEHVCGFAHRGWKIKSGMDTRFRLASISKMFTAVSILQLIEQNKLDFATLIVDLLDLGQTTIPPNVTIQHLLTMSSGIADWFEESENWEADWAALIRERPLYLLRKNADYLPLFSQKLPNFLAGQRYQYNNAGYILLGLALEAITKQTYFEYIRQHIFTPANMNNADFIGLDAIAPNLAEGYIRHKDGKTGQMTWQKNIYGTTPEAAADGGAVATAVDLFRFSDALRNGRLLSSKLTQAMLTPHIAQSDDPMRGYLWQYGYGNEFVFEQNKQLLRWGHTGEEDGVSCRLYHYPEQKLDVVILGNQSWCAGTLGWEIHDLIKK